ncbi:MAG: RNA-processing protein [Candidatus Aenigmarchaeota archaeon]|nr:RNA-processing protein [Candidatus Aenigmarchaeota archaeon]
MIEHISIPEERIALLRKTKGWKEDIKKFLDVNVEIGEDIAVSGDVLQVIRVKEIFRAFGRGFTFKDSLDLLDDEYVLYVITISEFAGKSKNRQTTLKGRIIGEGGKTKTMIEKYTNVKIAVYGKTVSMIGKAEGIIIAKEAIEMLLYGGKHATVYRFLEDKKILAF